MSLDTPRREGSLEAPTRHPVAWKSPEFWDEEKLFGERAARAGARGYVMKTSKPCVLKEAIHTILNGHLFFSGETTSRIIKKRSDPAVVLRILPTKENPTKAAATSASVNMNSWCGRSLTTVTPFA